MKTTRCGVKLSAAILLVYFLLGNVSNAFGKNLPAVTLQEKEVIDVEEKLDQNEIFLKSVFGLAFDGTYIYIMDNQICSIYKAKLDNFQLVKMLCSRGQSPDELAIPVGLCYKKDKLYVLDVGFGGVKVFDTEGKGLKQFRVPGASLGMGVICRYVINVSDDEEIYVRRDDRENGTLVSVYDMNGKLVRSLIPMEGDLEVNSLSNSAKNQLNFAFDHDGNVIVLFIKTGKLKKYDKQGKLLWAREILTALPKKERNEEDFKRSKEGIKGTVNFIGLAILEDNRIFASGIFSGVLVSAKGELIRLFKRPAGKCFGNLLFWNGSRLIGVVKHYDFSRYLK